VIPNHAGRSGQKGGRRFVCRRPLRERRRRVEDLVRRLTPKGLDTRATVLWAGDGTITVDVERQGLR
jgi:hypothetical protein